MNNNPESQDMKQIACRIKGKLVTISYKAHTHHLVFDYCGHSYWFKKIFCLNETYFNIKRKKSLNLA